MTKTLCRTVCWMPTWNKDKEKVGLEHLLLTDANADGVILGVDIVIDYPDLFLRVFA